MTNDLFETSQGPVVFMQNREEGFPVVFIHGNSLSSRTFIHQFNDPALERFRFIAFDLPGHGTTGRRENPELSYSPSSYVRIIVEVCMGLRASDGIIAGHSLGGHMAISALEFLPELRGALVFGTPPLTSPPRLDRAFLPCPALQLAFTEDLGAEDLEILSKGFVSPGSNVPEEIVSSLRESDPPVRSVIGKALMTGPTPDERSMISGFGKPFAVLLGEHDQLVSRNYFSEFPVTGIWKGEVQIIPGSGHSPQLENPEFFNKLISEFIANILQG